jgi:hypothetical protein
MGACRSNPASLDAKAKALAFFCASSAGSFLDGLHGGKFAVNIAFPCSLFHISLT